MIGVLAAMTVPHFGRAIESSRVEMSVARLKTIWTAQRVYWLSARAYASSVQDLLSSGLLSSDSAETMPTSCLDCRYTFDITTANETTLMVVATRVNSDKWAGELQVDESGQVTGAVIDQRTSYTIPASLFD